METLTRHCKACSKQLRGRTDKKFCNDYCRNNHNNQVRATSNNYIRNINNALHKNRRILEQFFTCENDQPSTTTSRLLMNGFQFRYFTHTCSNKSGTWFFCYDHGYLVTEEGQCLLVRREIRV